MFEINDYFVYSSRGVCCIDDICEKKLGQTNRIYYVFHPVTDSNNKIMTPVDNQKISMRAIMSKDEANNLIASFKEPNEMEWHESKKARDKVFDVILKRGDIFEHGQLLKLLMIKRDYARTISKKFADTDNRLLVSLQKLIYNELAVVLECTSEKVDTTIQDILFNPEG